MGRLDALIALVAGSTLVGFVGLIVYALLATVGVINAGSVSAGDAGGYGAGAAGLSVENGSHQRVAATLGGESVAYLDFGEATPLASDGSVLTAPIWVFIDGFDAEGRPQMSTEHTTIVDVVPGKPGYSDLWDVQFVLVPDGFSGPEIRSLEELNASGFQIMTPGMLVNCPIVEEGATTSEGHASRRAWYRGEEVFYFDLGVTTTTPGDVYEFVIERAGSNSYGPPTVERLDVPPLVVLPEDDGPPPQFFRRHEVTVPNAATAEAIQSADHFGAAGVTPRFSGELVNRPLLPD